MPYFLCALLLATPHLFNFLSQEINFSINYLIKAIIVFIILYIVNFKMHFFYIYYL